ncbi:histidine phosphatase family protein [Peribacillus sp. SCS-37]|uniref:histidine phosphatase family protein n=1 Tax=Paraperibacillus esterisolvens TaxID=3115296 RepID=UPI00390695FC
MRTYIYMVRHGESPKSEGNERTRGLTKKGKRDTCRVTDILQAEGVNVIVSSPYSRSILTLQELAKRLGQEVQINENLKEKVFSAEEQRLPDKNLIPLLKKSFLNPTFALKGGESNIDCQRRAIDVLTDVIKKHQGEKIAIGTHGAVMTLMMGYYDSRFDLKFLHQTSKPDIYRLEFSGFELVEATRLWEGDLGDYHE